MSLSFRKSLLTLAFPALGAAAALVLQGAVAQDKPGPGKPAPEKPSIQKPPATPFERTMELQKFMRKKLEASSRILEGLATEDPRLVQKGAEELSTMCDAEQWRISKDVMYRQFSDDFQRGTQFLGDAAKAGDLDKALVRWMDVTMQCIDCHRFVRDKLIATQPGASQPAPR